MLIYISEYNPIKLYEYSKEYQGGFKFFEDYTLRDAILSYQDEHNWKQSWQTNDTVKIQIQSAESDLSLALLDCDGAIIKSENFVQKTTNWHEANMPVWESYMSLDVNEGTYFFCIKNVEDIILISDPAEVAEFHENSLLLSYNHRRNKGDLAFDTGISFSLRLQSVLQEFSPGIDASVYIDQNRDTTVLSSTPYRIFKMIIGDALGVPDFIADKVNRIFGLSSVFVDDKKMARVEGANMQVNQNAEWALKGWSLDITEAINKDAVMFNVNPLDKKVISDNDFYYTDEEGFLLV